MTGLSSAAPTSETKYSKTIESKDGSLIICDTPGTNSFRDLFQSNTEIAHALNFMPVDLILITVKAEVRKASVVKDLREFLYLFHLNEFPMEIIGFCITHMDKVNWEEKELNQDLDRHLHIKGAVFSSLEKESDILIKQIKEECLNHEPREIHIDSVTFLRLFKIDEFDGNIVRQTGNEVKRFKKMKEDFFDQQANYTATEQKDMIFEFQTWMHDEILRSQKHLSCNNNFKFMEGPNLINEAGHISNLTNQLRQVLRDVRIEAQKYYKNVETDFRSCPYCGEIWQKIEGCEGATECGKRPTENLDLVDGGKMANFSFSWSETSQKLVTKKFPLKEKFTKNISNETAAKPFGCGKIIVWNEMKPITAPDDFHAANLVDTRDVIPVHGELMPCFKSYYNRIMEQMPTLQITRIKELKAFWFS